MEDEELERQRALALAQARRRRAEAESQPQRVTGPGDGLEATMSRIPRVPGGAGRAVGFAADWLTRRGRFESENLPEAGSQPVGADAPLGASARIGAGSFLTPDPNARADMYVNNIPGATIREDERGRLIVVYPDGREAYLNKPGISAQDVTDFIGEGAKYAGAIMTGGALPAGLRTLVTAAAAGGVSMGGDKAAQSFGSEQEPDAVRALLSAAFTAGGDKITRMVSGARNASAARSAGGEALEGAADAPPVNLDAEDAWRLQGGAADQFDVPLTRGQATRNPRYLGEESTGVRGGEGATTSRQMADFADEQTRRVTEAGRRIAGEPTTNNIDEAGNAVRAGMDDFAETTGREVNELYTAARDAGARVRVGSIDPETGAHNNILGERVRGALLDEFDVDILDPADAGLYPAIRGLVSRLDRMVSRAGDQGGGVADINRIEAIRKAAGEVARSGREPSERLFARRIVQTIDDYLDEAINNGDLIGPENAVGLFQNARAAAANRLSRIRAANSNDIGGRVVQDIFDKDLTSKQVVDRLFQETGKQKAASIQAIARIKEILEPNDPAAWQALREAYLQRLMSGSTGRFSFGNWIKSFERAVGDDIAVTRQLYSPEEITQMRRFLGLLRVVNNGMYEPSAPAFQRAGKQMLTAIAGILGMKAGGPIGAAAGAGSVRLGEGFLNRLRVAAALRGVPPAGRGQSAPAAQGAATALAVRPRRPGENEETRPR